MPTNPGSAEAKLLGCTCPVLDNHYGKGVVIDEKLDPDQFYVDKNCPIHVNKERLTHAERGGEGDSGGAATEIRYLDGDDLASSSVPPATSEPTGESEGATTLPGVDEGRDGDSQVGGQAEAGQPGRGPQA